MSEQWDGRPLNPEQSGMHLLRSRLTGHLTGWYWNAATERFHHEHITLGRTASLERYVYEGPIFIPSEIAAREEAAQREGAAKEREACAVVADSVVHANRVEAPEQWRNSRGGIPHHWQDAWEHSAETAEEIAAAIRARGDA